MTRSGEACTITYDDYLRLKGLFVLAGDHDRALKDIERAAAAVVGQEDEGGDSFGLVSDTIYDDRDVDRMLRRMDIAVERPTGTT